MAKRGFAAMDPATRRAIASKGGVSAHRSGRAHEWTHAEAQRAGRKGGLAPKPPRPDVTDATVPTDKPDAI